LQEIKKKEKVAMMQTILTAIAEGNLHIGTETMEHNSELKNAMKRVAIRNRVSSMAFVWVH